MTERDAWDRLFNCLQAKPRRQLVTGLADREPRERVHFADVLADTPTPGTPAHTEHVHHHLPRLADAGYIELDEETFEISRGPRFSEIEPFIGLIETHSERLPSGWV